MKSLAFVAGSRLRRLSVRDGESRVVAAARTNPRRSPRESVAVSESDSDSASEFVCESDSD